MIPSLSTNSIRQIAAIFGIIAVIFGAFGAHALKVQLSATALENWKTAVNYQFVHALALLLLATLPTTRFIRLSAWFFTLGIVCFSGSLYLLSIKEILNIIFQSNNIIKVGIDIKQDIKKETKNMF